MKEKLELKQIENKIERDIILHLKENGESMRGDIFMNLKLSYRKGHKYLNALIDKNWITNTENAPYYTLKIDIE